MIDASTAPATHRSQSGDAAHVDDVALCLGQMWQAQLTHVHHAGHIQVYRARQLVQCALGARRTGEARACVVHLQYFKPLAVFCNHQNVDSTEFVHGRLDQLLTKRCIRDIANGC